MQPGVKKSAAADPGSLSEKGHVESRQNEVLTPTSNLRAGYNRAG